MQRPQARVTREGCKSAGFELGLRNAPYFNTSTYVYPMGSARLDPLHGQMGQMRNFFEITRRHAACSALKLGLDGEGCKGAGFELGLRSAPYFNTSTYVYPIG